MSRIEKGAQLGRDLFDLNNTTWGKIAQLSGDNFKNYLELNQSYFAKLPEVSDVSSFVELQRTYGQDLWDGVQADLQARGEIIREAVEQTGGLVRGVFSAEENANTEAEVVEEAA